MWSLLSNCSIYVLNDPLSGLMDAIRVFNKDVVEMHRFPRITCRKKQHKEIIDSKTISRIQKKNRQSIDLFVFLGHERISSSFFFCCVLKLFIYNVYFNASRLF